MPYELHPDRPLRDAFSCGYQGAPPDQAEYLFLGLDANFAGDISTNGPLYTDVLEYLRDGPAYWVKHGVHHPLLRHQSSNDGWKYHSRFSQIGFRPNDAYRVSFVELLHVPTVGQSRLVPADLDTGHLARVAAWIIGGQVRYVFAARMVVRWLRRLRLFDELRLPAAEAEAGLSGWTLRATGPRLLQHSHFSAWGCQHEQLRADLGKIKTIVQPAKA